MNIDINSTCIIYIIFFIFFNQLIYLNINKISKFINIYDKLGDVSNPSASLIGGTIILLNLLLNLIFYFINDKIFNNFFLSDINFYSFISISILIYIIGLLDDKFNLKPYLRLIYLSFFLFLFFQLDKSIVIDSLEFNHINNVFFLGNFSIFFSILCFLLFINALNMFDGINLQVPFYALLTFFYFFFNQYNFFFLSIIIFLFYFLFLNKTGKFFLGDSGSYLIAYLISYISIRLYKENLLLSDDIFLIMFLPGIDMLRLFCERLFCKKNPFKGDNRHIHHIFLKRHGLIKTRIYVISLYVFPIFFSKIGINNYIIITFFIFYYIFLIYRNNNKFFFNFW